MKMVDKNVDNDEVREMFDAYKRRYQMPEVPNMGRMVANSVAGLRVHSGINASLEQLALPRALVAMLIFSIADHADCEYCAASYEMVCRQVGVDQVTLKRLSEDLGGVNPERLRSIIEFALKAAKNAQSLDEADFDRLREHGVTDDEIIQIIVVSGIALYFDLIADALKIPVDESTVEFLDNHDTR